MSMYRASKSVLRSVRASVLATPHPKLLSPGTQAHLWGTQPTPQGAQAAVGHSFYCAPFGSIYGPASAVRKPTELALRQDDGMGRTQRGSSVTRALTAVAVLAALIVTSGCSSSRPASGLGGPTTTSTETTTEPDT